MSLRASSYSLQSFTRLPRELLQSLSRTLGLNAVAIQVASLYYGAFMRLCEYIYIAYKLKTWKFIHDS